MTALTKSKKLQAIIFDMDDTIALTMQNHHRAWFDLCDKYRPSNINLKYCAEMLQQDLELIEKIHTGGTAEEFIEVLFGKLPENKLKKYAKDRESFFIQNASNIVAIKGIENFLKTCCIDLKIGIASSTSRPIIEHVLTTLDLKKFFKPEHIIDASHVKNGKPHPESYLRAAQALDIEPECCLVFEDSKSGIISAKCADMKVIGLATTLSKSKMIELGTVRVINNYTEIENLEELKDLF